MIIELLDKTSLTLLNRQLKYPLAIAEKDYFLTIVMKIISSSPIKNLIFKGGTAIYHTYLPQLRFSEDLDFSSNQTNINPSDIKSIFTKYDFLKIKKEYLSSATYKIEKLQYTGPLIQPNSLKVEIDFLQNVILPPQKIKYQNIWGLNFDVNVMDVHEIVAEKIRAMNDRVRYRDFYDFTMINKIISINIKKVISLVKQKEIRKPINPKNIFGNWQLALKEKQNELQSIYFSEDLTTKQVESSLSKLNFPTVK